MSMYPVLNSRNLENLKLRACEQDGLQGLRCCGSVVQVENLELGAGRSPVECFWADKGTTTGK